MYPKYIHTHTQHRHIDTVIWMTKYLLINDNIRRQICAIIFLHKSNQSFLIQLVVSRSDAAAYVVILNYNVLTPNLVTALKQSPCPYVQIFLLTMPPILP